MINNGLIDGPERRKLPRRLIAARQIASAEREASAARALLDGQAFERLSRNERIRHSAIHQAFYELVEVQGIAHEEVDIVLELFTENPEIVNLTLARFEMEGEWDAADQFERDIFGVLHDAKYNGEIHRLPRQHPDAKIEVLIPAGFTEEHGFVALRRNRRLIIAEHFDRDNAVRPHIEVDKVSTFALDIEKLNHLSNEAVTEVRLIVAATMLKAIGWDSLRRGFGELDMSDIVAKAQIAQGSLGNDDEAFSAAMEDLYNLANIMRHYNFRIEDVQRQAFDVERPSYLTGAEGLAFIEQAIHERSDLLTPAATTYYVHS